MSVCRIKGIKNYTNVKFLTKIFLESFIPSCLDIRYNKLYLYTTMKYMTVKEYADHIGKSVPLVYKQITEKKVKTAKKFGRILIKVK